MIQNYIDYYNTLYSATIDIHIIVLYYMCTPMIIRAVLKYLVIRLTDR